MLKVLVTQSCPTVCNPIYCIACQVPPSVEFSWQEYWSGGHSHLQGIFQTQGWNLGLLRCRQILYHLCHQGNLSKYCGVLLNKHMRAMFFHLANVLLYIFLNLFYIELDHLLGFPGGSESACNVGDQSSVPGQGRSPGEWNVSLLQYSCLENSLDREA